MDKKIKLMADFLLDNQDKILAAWEALPDWEREEMTVRTERLFTDLTIALMPLLPHLDQAIKIELLAVVKSVRGERR